MSNNRWVVKIQPRALNKGGVHHSLIMRAAQMIEKDNWERARKTHNKTFDVEGNRIFLAYEFHEDGVVCIKQARKTKKRFRR